MGTTEPWVPPRAVRHQAALASGCRRACGRSCVVATTTTRANRVPARVRAIVCGSVPLISRADPDHRCR
uniref:Uncharacterized protein n=1 Tax=Thermocrispum agreste TaxID=37925 RepID=A0A2W4JKK3_9PSEU|nr:MAG: hypothetical protein DIU77_14545 [Thermocrispum agreste]